jgi:hypothetical protein
VACYIAGYEQYKLSPAAQKAIKPGKILLQYTVLIQLVVVLLM